MQIPVDMTEFCSTKVNVLDVLIIYWIIIENNVNYKTK